VLEFQLFGGACLGLGVFVLVEKNQILVLTRSASENADNLDAPSLLESAAYALISGGGFIFGVAFLGCCGAITRSKCMLIMVLV
jgi:hypothetical protein